LGRRLIRHIKESVMRFRHLLAGLIAPIAALGSLTVPAQATDVGAGFGHVIQMSGGERFGLALRDDGTVWAWGDNEHGQLGGNFPHDSYRPVRVTGLADIVAISAGWKFSLALRSDGTVWAWGSNVLGQLGDGTTVRRPTPVRTVGLHDVVAVSAGYWHSLALLADGTVWSWGWNAWGQLGDGTRTSARLLPTQVKSLYNVEQIDGGDRHSTAVDTFGLVWAWGANNKGQLGDGSDRKRRRRPARVYVVRTTSVSAGKQFTVAVAADGSVWSWGLNDDGQLGDGTRTSRPTPVRVTGIDNVAAVATGREFSLAMQTDGALWSWGSGSDGQLGLGAGHPSEPSPVLVTGLDHVAALGAGGTTSYAARANRSAWSWGDNQRGQLGNGSKGHYTYLPAPVVRP
jgi:alpha-tubulin suppressor-like RCC1 family protein